MTRPAPFAPRLTKERRVVIAGAQFAVVPNDIPTNLYRCVYFLRRAVEDYLPLLRCQLTERHVGAHAHLPAHVGHQ